MGLNMFSDSTKMPKRIAIIDDRPNRPYLHLSEDVIKQLQKLPNVQFFPGIEDVDLEQFDIIAIHRSYVINNNLMNVLDSLLKNNAKYLVLFSGGVSQPTVTEKGHKATVGSEVFYSPHLYPFCQELTEIDEIQLYKLLYGIGSWKLPILMRLRQLYWLDPDEDDPDIDDEKEEIEDALDINTPEELEKNIQLIIKVL